MVVVDGGVGQDLSKFPSFKFLSPHEKLAFKGNVKPNGWWGGGRLTWVTMHKLPITRPTMKYSTFSGNKLAAINFFCGK